MTTLALGDTPTTPDVFVNYRTDDGHDAAVFIERELSRRFGAQRIFRSSRSIQPGTPWKAELLEKARNCSALIAVVGHSWVDHPALRDPEDWVRREILEAQANGALVIPVLNGRLTNRLRASDLPPELAAFAGLHSHRVDSHTIERDLAVLGDLLAAQVPALRQADQTHPTPSTSAPDRNSIGETHGPAAVGETVWGDTGTVVKGNTGQTHLGHGDQYYNAANNSTNFSGAGGTYIAGDYRTGENRAEGFRTDRQGRGASLPPQVDEPRDLG